MATVTTTKAKVIKKTASKPIEAEEASKANFAVIETGGKQYGVAEGEVIKIEKIKGDLKEGGKVVFDKVLLKATGVEDDHLHIGAPYVVGTKVSGTITEVGRNKKVTVIHYKQKSRYFKKAGHRQPFFKVKINSIS